MFNVTLVIGALKVFLFLTMLCPGPEGPIGPTGFHLSIEDASVMEAQTRTPIKRRGEWWPMLGFYGASSRIFHSS